MNITIDQLLCLKMVATEGSITKASEKLFRAKSAVNYSLKTLETQVGFQLIDKKGYRSKLTEKGHSFLLKSNVLLQEYEALIDNTQKIKSSVEMKLSISISANCSADRMYDVIKQAMLKYPCTEIKLHREILSGQTLLENKVVDIALFESQYPPQGLESFHLYDLRLPLAIASSHPFLKLPKKSQTLENLNQYPRIIMANTIQTTNPNDLDNNNDDYLKWYVPDISSKFDMIAKGLGWGRLPDYIMGKEQLSHLKHLDELDSLGVYLARRNNDSPGEVSRFIWQHCLGATR